LRTVEVKGKDLLEAQDGNGYADAEKLGLRMF
jgi:hypothetical protein